MSVRKRVVFAGAGHAALIALDHLARRRVEADLTLVSSGRHTFYSGMLAGWMEGLYTRDEFAIDVAAFCDKRGIAFVDSEVEHFTDDALTVDGVPLPFDLCVLNTGAVAASPPPLSAATVLPAKPAGPLICALGPRLACPQPFAAVIVGAGIAGVECAMSLAVGRPDVRVALLDRSQTLLAALPRRVARTIEQRLRMLDIDLHLGTTVRAVTSSTVRLASGAELAADVAIAFTGASPPGFLARSPLALAADGFVAVDAAMRTSVPNILAVGDVATNVADPRPKAGVFAVRSGVPLARQVGRFVAGVPLATIRLQRRGLAIVSLGERRAIAVRGRLVLSGRSMWRLKDRFDRAFVQRFAD